MGTLSADHMVVSSEAVLLSYRNSELRPTLSCEVEHHYHRSQSEAEAEDDHPQLVEGEQLQLDQSGVGQTPSNEAPQEHVEQQTEEREKDQQTEEEQSDGEQQDLNHPQFQGQQQLDQKQLGLHQQLEQKVHHHKQHYGATLSLLPSLRASEQACPEIYSPPNSVSGRIVLADSSSCKRSELESKCRKFESPVLSVDWDEINGDTLRRTLSVTNRIYDHGDALRSISFLDAVRALKCDRSSWEPYALPLRLQGRGKHSKFKRFFKKIFFCCASSSSENQVVGGSELRTNSSKQLLQHDVDFCCSLPSIPFDHSNVVHRRLLMTIRNELLQDDENNDRGVWVEWEKLGFQGCDPATDLRSTGLLGLLQIVFLLEYYRTFAICLWETCTNEGHQGKNVFEELPFVLIGFNFTAVVLDELKDARTSVEVMRRSRNNCGVVDVKKKNQRFLLPPEEGEAALRHEFPFVVSCCEYYVGCLYQFWELWHELKRQRGGRPPKIGDFGVVKAKLCASIRRKGAAQVFSSCSAAEDPAVELNGSYGRYGSCTDDESSYCNSETEKVL
uniref:ELMO domain-containing protein n=1 Tax=Trypanosoma congolense (strain IL3000) TaxID=1068625 RepID=G0UWH0_TRYCI|nr:conserved hypothetical protein [Trypanosoma congolense IL3000]